MRPELKVPACPDRQMISLYCDGELPSPWKEKMEAHLESCKKCRATLAGYRKLEEQLREEPKNMEAAQQRVWERLASLDGNISIEPDAPRAEVRRRWPGGGNRIWNTPPSQVETKIPFWLRNITLPLPVAAAAVLVFVVFFALIGIRGLTRPEPQDQVMAIGNQVDDMGMIPMQDMAGVLQYLASQDNIDFMIIPLPEVQKFSRIGEPALINAADYSRRNASR